MTQVVKVTGPQQCVIVTDPGTMTAGLLIPGRGDDPDVLLYFANLGCVHGFLTDVADLMLQTADLERRRESGGALRLVDPA